MENWENEGGAVIVENPHVRENNLREEAYQDARREQVRKESQYNTAKELADLLVKLSTLKQDAKTSQPDNPARN
jgi:hypothetical protein